MKLPPFGDKKIWHELTEKFSAANRSISFEQKLALALARVTVWRWANDNAYNPTPFHREIFKAPALKWQKSGTGVVEHGLDTAGTVWIMRRWPSAIKENCTVTLIERQPEMDDEYSYPGRWAEGDLSRLPQTIELKSLHQHRRNLQGQLTASYSFSARGFVLSEFFYEGDRLTRSLFLSEQIGKPFFSRREYQYAYDTAGKIKEITYEHFLMPERRLIEKKSAYKQKLK